METTDNLKAALSPEQRRVDGYQATVARFEPDIHRVDQDAAMTSIAISLKRIADVLCENATMREVHKDQLISGIERAIHYGMASK